MEEEQEQQEATLEVRMEMVEDEIELLKTDVLPMLLEIRERVRSRDEEV